MTGLPDAAVRSPWRTRTHLCGLPHTGPSGRPVASPAAREVAAVRPGSRAALTGSQDCHLRLPAALALLLAAAAREVAVPAPTTSTAGALS